MREPAPWTRDREKSWLVRTLLRLWLPRAIEARQSVGVSRGKDLGLTPRRRWEEAGAGIAWKRIQMRFPHRYNFRNRGELLVASDVVAEFGHGTCRVNDVVYRYHELGGTRWEDDGTKQPVIRLLPRNVLMVAGERFTLRGVGGGRPCFTLVELVSFEDSVVVTARHLPPPTTRLSWGRVVASEAAIARQLPHWELLAYFAMSRMSRFQDQGPYRWPKDLRGT
jgi:hypothetical protein